MVCLVGIKDATSNAQMTRNAPNTNGGPGTSCKKREKYVF